MSNLYDHVERYGHFSIRYKMDGDKLIEIYAIYDDVLTVDKYMMYMTRSSTVESNNRKDKDYSRFYFDNIQHVKECIDTLVHREPERFI